MGAIAGIAVGCGIALVSAVLLSIFLWRRRKLTKQDRVSTPRSSRHKEFDPSKNYELSEMAGSGSKTTILEVKADGLVELSPESEMHEMPLEGYQKHEISSERQVFEMPADGMEPTISGEQ
jgi:hypothetical protein